MEEKLFLEKERIGAFLGKEGKQKKEFEEKFKCQIDVESNSGEVFINGEDSVSIFILTNIISAINYGLNPKNAMKLEDENFVLDIIDVKQTIKDQEKLKKVMGRIIGKDGATRRTIEEITKCNLAIKDHFVAVVGPYENTILIHDALNMLIKGSSFKSFYSYLERNKVKLL
jgi:ribosomal RNA assembly protein